jgi:adsorption protein B
MLWLDRLCAGVLAPLAMWVLASGLDDLFLDLSAICFWLKKRFGRQGPGCLLRPEREKSIALLIPAWREAGVIEQMLEQNIGGIRYSNYEVFVGVYPNDLPTLSRVVAAEKTCPRVHHALCPHDGPTSKADCLNAIYQAMLAWEEGQGRRFEVILHHDAEDVVHPGSLRSINAATERYDMVQVPVLPLDTPCWELTHGAYCDDFAQSHLRDLHTRVALGGFLPSCGVGTAYRRRSLERLAWNNGGRLFRPDCLAEDYLIGLELHRLGCSQVLLDAKAPGAAGLAATREYFPRSFGRAVRQRARWVAGIALQSWQHAGWNAGPRQLYWLWRDRKALLNIPLTILANLIFVYGLAGWGWAAATGSTWRLREMVDAISGLRWLLVLNVALLVMRQLARITAVWPAYGVRHALVTPLRSLWGNRINFAAWWGALKLFAGAQLRRRVPAWAKTDHAYPAQPQLARQRRRLGEVLAETGILAAPAVERAFGMLQPGERLGEALVRLGALSEFQLYTALSMQQGIPFGPVEPELVSDDALERLPAQLARRRQLVPVGIIKRRLWLATPELPADEIAREVAEVTRLEPRFQLVTPSNYRLLSRRAAR